MITSPSSRRLAVSTISGLLLATVLVDAALAQEPARPVLRLAFFDTVGLEQSVTNATQRRVEDTFEQIGVDIRWIEPRSVSNTDDAETPYYLKVILFDKEAAAMGQPTDAMGISFNTDALPDTVWLFDPVICRALEGAAGGRRPLTPTELGRAYGRVVAHEVIHAVASDMRHADAGVMAPTQNRNVLLSRDTDVDPESTATFLRGLARVEATLAAGG